MTTEPTIYPQYEAALRTAFEANDPTPLAEIPYAKFLGLEVELDPDAGAAPDRSAILVRMRFAPKLIGDATIPALHGGTIAGLLESTAICSVIWKNRDLLLPKVITLTIDYLRSGRPQDTTCVARFIRLGKRIAVVQVQAFQTTLEEPIASATVHLLMPDPHDIDPSESLPGGKPDPTGVDAADGSTGGD